MSRTFGSNKMGPLRTANKEQCVACGSSFLASHRGDIPWPARSPDLGPCDFFAWGYLKGEVYRHRPRNLVELKMAIREEIQQITPAYDHERHEELQKTS